MEARVAFFGSSDGRAAETFRIHSKKIKIEVEESAEQTEEVCHCGRISC